MKKILINSVLLLIFMGLLLVPNYPFLHYYLVKSQPTISNTDINIENNKTLIGDIAYLNAILHRSDTSDEENDKKAPLPETNNHFNHLVFINSNNIELNKPHNINCGYSIFNSPESPKIYLTILTPPPNFLS